MTQKHYLRALTNNAGSITSGEKSTTEPVAASTWGLSPTTRDLSATKGAAGTSHTATPNNNTSAQNGCVGRWCSAGLAAGTYGSGTWNINIQTAESSTNFNMFHCQASIYFWRPGTSSVVGFVIDSDTSSGVEFGNNVANTRYGQALSWTGSNVTIQDGDILVFELWVKGTPSMGTNGTLTVYYDGTTDVTSTYSGTDPASYINAPADIPEKTVVAVSTVAATASVPAVSIQYTFPPVSTVAATATVQAVTLDAPCNVPVSTVAAIGSVPGITMNTTVAVQTVAAIGTAHGAFDPNSIADLIVRLESFDSTTIVASSGAATGWNDQSSSPNNFSSTGTSTAPTMGTRTTPSGVGALDFDGTDDVVSSGAAITVGQGQTLFVVMASDTGADGVAKTALRDAFTGGSPALGIQKTAGNVWAAAGNGVTITTAITVDTNFHLFTAKFDNPSGYFRVDGVQTDGALGSGTRSGFVFRVGSNSGPTSWWNGPFAAVLLYNRLLTDDEVAKIEAHLNSRYFTGVGVRIAATADVAVSTVAATASVPSVTIDTPVNQDVPVSTVAATGAVPSVSISASANVPPTTGAATPTVGSTTLGGGTASPSTSHTFSHTVDSGTDVLVVRASCEEDTAAVTWTATYNGVAMTEIVRAVNPTEVARENAAIFYMDSPPVGTANVVLTVSENSSGQVVGSATNLSGVALGGPAASTSGTTEVDGTTFSTTFSGLTVGWLVLDAITANQVATWTPDAGQTETDDQSVTGTSGSSQAGSYLIADATSKTLGWTSSVGMGRFTQVLAAWAPAETPTTVKATGSVPPVTIGLGADVAVSTVQATASVPSVAISTSGNADVPVSTVAATGAVPAVTISATGTVSPNTVAAAATVRTVTISATATVAPAVVAGTASVPAVTISTTANVTPNAVAATATVPSVTISAVPVVQPNMFQAVATVQSVTISTAVGPVVNTFAATGSVPAVTISTTATVVVSAVSATGSVPAVNVLVEARPTPNSFQAVASVPSVTVLTVAAPAPNTFAATASVPSVTISATAVVPLSPVAATATVQGVAVQTSGATTVPVSTVVATATVRSVTIQATAVVPLNVVGAVGSVPAVAIATTAVSTPPMFQAVATVQTVTLLISGAAILGPVQATATVRAVAIAFSTGVPVAPVAAIGAVPGIATLINTTVFVQTVVAIGSVPGIAVTFIPPFTGAIAARLLSNGVVSMTFVTQGKVNADVQQPWTRTRRVSA